MGGIWQCLINTFLLFYTTENSSFVWMSCEDIDNTFLFGHNHLHSPEGLFMSPTDSADGSYPNYFHNIIVYVFADPASKEKRAKGPEERYAQSSIEI